MQCRMLPGSSVSAAVYLPLVQAQGTFLFQRNTEVIQETQSKLQELFERIEALPDACSLRLLLLTEFTADRALGALVPINALRNAALLAIRTPLAAMIDVDLAVSDSLRRVLAQPDRLEAIQQASTVFWVLPTWEAEGHLKPEDAQNTVLSAIKGPPLVSVLFVLVLDVVVIVVVHATRSGCRCCGKPGTYVRFQKTSFLRVTMQQIIDGMYRNAVTDRWLSTDQPYTIRYGRGYEPWGVTSRKQYTWMPYDVRFRGCFRDKVTQVASLAYINTSFAALPDAWLVHQPHQLSAAASIAVGRLHGGPLAAGKRIQALQQGTTYEYVPFTRKCVFCVPYMDEYTFPHKRVSWLRVQALHKVVFYRGINTTKFMLHKAHSLVTSDEALGAMAAGRYEPVAAFNNNQQIWQNNSTVIFIHMMQAIRTQAN
ncbi:hypothetical protein VOLCADRAFT_91750 [Volvox carteri f. nagariensis]|uniref:Uncharacterized protein n=1 Tax=Volvox carteri f. nagariensis TaxID=3068 RepID=D8TXV5_VOLCA|nr:uncharacterized protein VOLCADRAFT_91750 [Volvox carteri f. nagariensis]EFJ47787.1 hypothetical protein VOLCADRAFT_91750 [Volvox carteri f. nagariensis]|eukprot:XP_002951258.1 hypothetical protein VOLCADRAFT_91750 [Volvox carteri f. nagariensis]